MRTIICAAMLVLTAPTAKAAEDKNKQSSANYWLPRCKAFIANSRSDRIGALRGEDRGATFASCASVPEGVIAVQAVRVVVRYIGARPQRTRIIQLARP